MRKSTIRPGERIGKLIAIEIIGRASTGGHYWLMHCDCGNDRIVTSGYVRRISSCGCGRKPHGHSSDGKQSKTYMSWQAMLRRCYYAKHPAYHLYGGRPPEKGGPVTVCPRWLNGEGELSAFQCFLADMGERPPNKSLDRINNTGGYHPSNCRWATSKQQAENRTEQKIGEKNHNAKLTDHKALEIRALNGVLSCNKIAERYGVCKKTVLNILHGKTWKHAA